MSMSPFQSGTAKHPRGIFSCPTMILPGRFAKFDHDPAFAARNLFLLG
jgi:hypothetical protein